VLVKLLALDAATEACSVALLANGEVREREALEARAQSELLLPMIDSLLSEAGLRLDQLDALVVGRGPGSFTGVRLAVGVAQGLAYGAQLRVIPVSDLAMLAQAAIAGQQCDHVLACMDARMEEVYWCSFVRGEDGLVTPLQQERLGPPDSVLPAVSAPFVGVGTGWTRHEQLRTRLATSLVALAPYHLPRARDAVTLAAPLWRAGEMLAPEQVLPVYLRDEVATRPRR
jgi:tRNA threonylcarbamoyladenosine biosynthesis protein TsaB